MMINIPDELILQKISQATHIYSYYCNKDFLYISLSTNKNNMFMFEAQYTSGHFQHLCGIDSATMSPSDFYKNAINDNVTLNDCTPSRNHTRHEVLDKLNSLIYLLNIKNTKMFRTGNRLHNVGNVDFDFAVGDSSFIGYKIDSRTKTCFPLTNMIAPIADYCVNPKRVSLILSKSSNKDLYDTVEYEASKNLLGKIDLDVAESISAFLDASLLYKTKIPNELIANEHNSLSGNVLLDEVDVINNGENERER